MTMTVDLIDALEEARANAIRFNENPQLLKEMSRDEIPFGSFRCWYYFSDLDIFAPSKFIGYKNTTLENYSASGREEKDGRETEPLLRKWFIKIKPKSPQHDKMKAQLDDYADTLEKKINAGLDNSTDEIGGAGIYVAK